MYGYAYPYSYGGYGNTKQEINDKINFVEKMLKDIIANEELERQVINIFKNKLSKVPIEQQSQIDTVINKILFEIMLKKY